MAHPQPISRELADAAADPVRIFCLYTPGDELLFKEFSKHLAPLEYRRAIEVWSDQKIAPGSDRDKIIREELRQAEIIIILVSQAALSDDHFYHTEIKMALERHNEGTACVIPVILSACGWKDTPLSNLRPLPKQGQPVMSRSKSKRVQAWQEVIAGLKDVLADRSAQRNAAVHTTFPVPSAGEPHSQESHRAASHPVTESKTPDSPTEPRRISRFRKLGKIVLGLFALVSAMGIVLLIGVVLPVSCDRWLGSGPVSAIAYAPNGQYVASAVHKVVTVWNTNTRHEVCMVRGHTDSISSTVFSASARVLLTASADGTARLWRADTCQMIHALAMPASKGATVANFSHDTTRLVTASDDGITRVWSMTDFRDLFSLDQPTASIDLWAEFSPDDQQIVTTNYAGDVKLWRSRDGSLLHRLTGHEGAVWKAAFSPDGLFLATAGQDQTVRVWRVADGQPAVVLTGHTQAVLSVRFSPDGKSLVTASSDGSARVWSWRENRPTAILLGHVRGVSAAEFSSDGKTVITGSDDHSVRVWDTASGKELYKLHGINSELPARPPGSP